MKTFLSEVAHDLYNKTNGDFSHVAVVFPNKRASLFFNEYLVEEAGHPIWSPAYISISELFRKNSTLEVGDPIKLVCELYQIFRKATGSKESLDDFYFWGELLISDFDDADKNLADTDALFSNLKDLNKLTDSYSFLEEGQREALSQFFRNFSIEQVTELKKRFIDLWDVLGSIYTQFRERLQELHIAYEGMLYRQVIEDLDVNELSYDKYIFVGFNVLNKVEQTLFSKLNEAGKALFYWDYDNFYLNLRPHEAGEFIRRNLQHFPSELPVSTFNHLNEPKEITYVESPTENGQARYLPDWIRTHLTEKEKETAVVLCNENLLQPVLHSLPENIEHINITMGFPLAQTPAHSFIIALMELHTTGYNPTNGRFQYAEVQSVLKHPYTHQLSAEAIKVSNALTHDNRFFPLPSELMKDETLELLFTPCTNNRNLCLLLSQALKRVAILYKQQAAASNAAFDQLYRESLFKAYTLVNRFYTLIESGDLDVKPDTFKRLLTRVMSTSNIPFHGEPAIGMQVMGVLETRNLDFRHLILLSVNEGQLPKSGGDASFIPYNLRKAFGMTTIDHKIAVYAYYFYRLLQRAEKVTLLYNTATEGTNRGEMSRFMLQFLIEWKHSVQFKRLEAGQSPQVSEAICIRKTPEIMKRMQERFDIRVNPKALLSPSALNCYLDCELRFYYKYVAGLKAPEAVSADIDSAMFGTIFHYTAEQIYKDLTANGKVINKETLENLLNEKGEIKLQNYVDNSFKKLFFNVPENERPEYNGLQYLNSAVIFRYIRRLLSMDKDNTPFTFVASEKPVSEEMDVQTPKGKLKLRIGGIIDRLDRKDNVLRIVDYKTSGSPECPPDVDSLFISGKKRSNYVFQTFLYASIVCKKLREAAKDEKVAPALLFINRAADENYIPIVQLGEKQKEPVENFAIYETAFRDKLKELLETIFNPELPFNQTVTEEKCSYCDFRELCKK